MGLVEKGRTAQCVKSARREKFGCTNKSTNDKRTHCTNELLSTLSSIRISTTGLVHPSRSDDVIRTAMAYCRHTATSLSGLRLSKNVRFSASMLQYSASVTSGTEAMSTSSVGLPKNLAFCVGIHLRRCFFAAITRRRGGCGFDEVVPLALVNDLLCFSVLSSCTTQGTHRGCICERHQGALSQHAGVGCVGG